LSESDITVKEVSEMLGFEDQFHFSKAFKKHFGESPSIYR
jgi:AraC-like DNA-binding protein